MAKTDKTEQAADEQAPKAETAEAKSDADTGDAPQDGDQAGDGTPDAGDTPPKDMSIEEQLSATAAERDDYKDRMMRALAEAENVRRRAERDQKDALVYGGTRLARDLLSVYDNLSRALAAADDGLRENHKNFLEGVELTQRELTNAFAKHKIEAVAPKPGEKFDPNRHQAMFEIPTADAEAGSIVEVVQEGFMIADRLLRPALVGVAKSPTDSEGTETAKPDAEAAETQQAEKPDAEASGNETAKDA